MVDKESTREISSKQEEHIAKIFGGQTNGGSGSGHFQKGDIYIPDASLLIEGKTSMTEKSSFSVKKDWIIKNKQEQFARKVSNGAIAISFDPSGKENYYLINENLMRYLVDKLKEEWGNN